MKLFLWFYLDFKDRCSLDLKGETMQSQKEKLSSATFVSFHPHYKSLSKSKYLFIVLTILASYIMRHIRRCRFSCIKDGLPQHIWNFDDERHTLPWLFVQKKSSYREKKTNIVHTEQPELWLLKLILLQF